MKQAALIAITILLVSGCASYGSYSEMVDRRMVEEDPEIQAELDKRIERFETDADEMARFNEVKARCLANADCIWFCMRRSPGLTRKSRNRTNEDISLEKRVRIYRMERGDCGPVSRGDLHGVLGM